MSTAYQTIGRDYITFRTVNAKRKTAQEVLNETRALFVKSTPNGTSSGSALDDDEDKEMKKGKRPRTKGGSAVHSGHSVVINDNFEDELKKLISQESTEIVVCHQDEANQEVGEAICGNDGDEHFTEMSPPASEAYFTLPEERPNNDVSTTLTSPLSQSSSSKSYGKPPSINDNSSSSLGGSYSKVEQKLTDWVKIKGPHESSTVKQPIKSKTFGSSCELTKSSNVSPEGNSPSGDVVPLLSPLPESIEEFFSRLGLSEGDYESLTKNNSRSSSPVYFPSVSSKSSTTSRRWANYNATVDPAGPMIAAGVDGENKESVSVIETNARILKWLRSTSKFFTAVNTNTKVAVEANS